MCYIICKEYKNLNKFNISEKSYRIYEGIIFDSKAEMSRYIELKILESSGIISELSLQPRFTILDKGYRNRKRVYTADFMYAENGVWVVEDVKGKKTEAYSLRRDIFLSLYPQYIFRENTNGVIKEYKDMK